MSNPETTIGRYTLESRLAQGGMAAVFLGRMAGPGGFFKKVVVKRILPEHASDPTFVEMFLFEARLAALLNHPNVVQVYDFGEERGEYYLAMEFIDGVSVRALLRRQRRLEQLMPPRIVAHIGAMAATGLVYAHRLSDEQGVPLNLVHRDISPDNLLVTRDGVVKVVDFGVARVANQATRKTETGLVKGKLGYMPPEQMSGEPIDHRADQFALGVALYELLAGERPFIANNDLELALTIMERDAQPLVERVPGLDPKLAAIVEKALQKDRTQRFDDMRAMQEALEEFLGSARQEAAALATLVAVTAAELGDSTDLSLPAVQKDEVRSVGPRRSRIALIVTVAFALAVVVGLGVGWLLAHRAPVEATRPPPVVTAPVVAPVEPEPEAAPVVPLPVPPVVEPSKPDEPVASPRRPGQLTVRTTPWAEVTLDDKPVGPTPLVNLKVSAGSHTLEFANEKLGISQKLQVKVGAGESVTRTVKFRMGTLKVTAPAGSKVFRGSELLGVTPMQPVPLAAGKHTLGVIVAGGKFVNRVVTVPAGGEAQLALP